MLELGDSLKKKILVCECELPPVIRAKTASDTFGHPEHGQAALLDEHLKVWSSNPA